MVEMFSVSQVIFVSYPFITRAVSLRMEISSTNSRTIVRLSFQKSGQTFAEAAAEIDEYFKSAVVATSDATAPGEVATSGDVSDDMEGVIKTSQGNFKEKSKVEPGEHATTESIESAKSTHPADPVEPVEATEDSSARPPHRGPPRHSFIPPQIFQAMVESNETSAKYVKYMRPFSSPRKPVL